jgi:hypothetical protein
MYPTQFSDASLAITCNPLCAVGNTFSLALTMSNFALTQQRPHEYPDLNFFVGTLTLVTKPIVLTTSSGIEMARFSLTGDLLGCSDVACANPLFTLHVYTHGPARITYNLNGSQLSINSVQYVLPEPSSLTLLGTGLLFLFGKFHRTVVGRFA